MPDERRAARTADKTRTGGLPAPMDRSRGSGLGDGSPCDGCSETIAPTEILFDHAEEAAGIAREAAHRLGFDHTQLWIETQHLAARRRSR